MGERALTVRDRIIVHLAGYNRYSDEFECPVEMCQSGISEAIGKSRAHTTLELNRMKEAGLVIERMAHIRGAKSKRKTYLLTSEAVAVERNITNHLKQQSIWFSHQDEKTLMDGGLAVERILSEGLFSKALAYDIVLSSKGTVDMSNLELPKGFRSADKKPSINMEPGHPFDAADKTVDAQILHANQLSRRGSYNEALEILQKVIDKKTGRPQISKAIYSRASIYRKMGNYSLSLGDINKAIKLADNDLMKARCNMEKAMILQGSGRGGQSLKLLALACQTFAKENSQLDHVRCLINQAIVLRSRDSIPESIKALEDAMVLAEQASIDRMQAYAMVNLSDILNSQGEYKRSKELAIQSRDIFQVLNEPLMLAASLFNLGTALAGLHEEQLAIKNLDEAISILENDNLLVARTDWLEAYAKILKKMGQNEKAGKVLDKI